MTEVPATSKVKSKATAAVRLTPELAQAYAPIPHALLLWASEIKLEIPQADGTVRMKKLRPAHIAVICYLMASKFDERNPWPSASTIRARLGVSYNLVLDALDDLDKSGLVRRNRIMSGDAERDPRKVKYEYDLSGLFDRLTLIHRKRIAPRLDKQRGDPGTPVDEMGKT
jgi:hypothetical protein